VLTYGDGSSGTTVLRKSLSAFINANFSPHPTQLIHPHQITILSGVGACVDAICFCVAEEGDGVLLVRPAYVGFEGDLEDRAQ
jgi:aspartate/methionine/tyrosine aminotransferase